MSGLDLDLDFGWTPHVIMRGSTLPQDRPDRTVPVRKGA
jgi:hypothetical protein